VQQAERIDERGVKCGFMTTIHAYINDQQGSPAWPQRIGAGIR